MGVAYRNACNAVICNEFKTHENHCFPVNRIFFLTKITRYRVIFIMLVLSVPAYLLSESLCYSKEGWWVGVGVEVDRQSIMYVILLFIYLLKIEFIYYACGLIVSVHIDLMLAVCCVLRLLLRSTLT